MENGEGEGEGGLINGLSFRVVFQLHLFSVSILVFSSLTLVCRLL